MSASYYHCVDDNYPLNAQTIGDVIRKLRSECAPDFELLSFSGTNERITVEQLVTQSLKYAKGMIGLGLKKGDLICLLGVKSSTFCSLACAAGYIGLQFSGAFIYEPFKLTSMKVINKMEAKLVVIGSEHKGQLLKETTDLFSEGPDNGPSDNVPTVKHLFCDRRSLYEFDVDSKFLDLDFLNKSGADVSDDELERYSRMTTSNTAFFNPLSSGSTGEPKRIVASPGEYVQPRWSDSEQVALRKDFALGVVPPSFDDLISLAILFDGIHFRQKVAFIHTSTTTIGEQFVREILEVVQKERIMTMYHAPAFWKYILQNPEILKEYDVSCLKEPIFGGSVLTKGFKRKVLDIFPHTSFLYGSSESCRVTRNGWATPREKKVQYIGQLDVNKEVMVVDESGVPVLFGSVGELWVRAQAFTCLGVKTPEGLKSVVRNDGWYPTGDMAVLSEDGYLDVIGRKKDQLRFKRYGDVVYPAPIENAMVEHPGISEICVIGLQDDDVGNEIVYCVVPVPGTTLTTDEVTDFAKSHERLTALQWPASVCFFQSIPVRGPRRKVDKQQLTEAVEKMLAESEKKPVILS